ncbi:NUDIX domain-containing protein [Patescibacteria group bacterium]|nr:NUDIX domain-containing protein [Patescibacteria group bacterium]MBU1613063.1 NUDIX domain-containing protein [Patescibacteria group bacterium]
MSRPKTISTEIVHQNPWWTYYRDKIILTNGQESEYYYGESRWLGGSMVIPVLDDGRILLTVQHRYPRDKQSMEFPCGGMKENEHASVCAERELLEETGYRAEEMMKIGTFEGLNAVFKNAAHIFLATGLDKIQEVMIDPQECIEVVIRRVDEFEEMVERGEIWDGQTLAAWALAKNRVYKILGE